MIGQRVFHIYKKNTTVTEVIKHSVTTDELETMMKEKLIDWDNMDIVPVDSDYGLDEDASF